MSDTNRIAYHIPGHGLSFHSRDKWRDGTNCVCGSPECPNSGAPDVEWPSDEPTFQVPARGLDAQEGRQWSDVYADDLTAEDLAAMGPAERAEAERWRAAIDHANRCTDVVALHNQEPDPRTEAECQAEAASAA